MGKELYECSECDDGLAPCRLLVECETPPDCCVFSGTNKKPHWRLIT